MDIESIKRGLLQKLQQVGQGFSQGVQTVQKNPVGKAFINSNPLIGVAEGITSNRPTTAPGQYVRNQVINQVSQGFHEAVNGFQQRNALNAGMGALRIGGGIYNATPTGVLFNSAIGTATGVAKTTRTGQPIANIPSNVFQNITNPADFAGEGLGIKNPFLAMGINLLASNPKGAMSSFSKGKGALNALKGVNPKAFSMHPEDIQDAKSAIDILRYTKSAKPQDKKYAMETIQNILDFYIPGHKYSKTKQALDALEHVIQTNEKVPGNLRTPFPAVGLIDETVNGAKGSARAAKIAQELSKKSDIVPSNESVSLKSFTQKGSYTNTKADLIASKFRSPGNLPPQKAIEDVPLLQKVQTEPVGQQLLLGERPGSGIPSSSPELLGGKTLQQKKLGASKQESLVHSTSTTSIQRPVKNDFEAEMDALIGKPIERGFTGKSKMKNMEPTALPGDQATTDFASGRAAMGGGGFKGLDKNTQDEFQGWVNNRRAVGVESYLKKKEFSDLNSKGIKGIFEFQSGNKAGRYGDLKKYFDSKYKQLQDNKIQFDYRQDYLPQLWKNTPEEVNQVLGRRMGMKPSFTLDAVFKSYQEGIAAGLKPRFQNIADLTGWYEQKANKAIADKHFFDYLGKEGSIMPSTKAPQEWVTLDPDRFPKFLTNIGDQKYSGSYKAPKELADVINNYLQGARSGTLEKIANFVSRVKNTALNFGIPGTAINAHGVNILARHTLMGTGGNPVSRFLTGSKYVLHPKSAEKALDTMLLRAPAAVKNGLVISAEDYTGLGKHAENVAGQFSKKWEDAFGAPLFNKMLPALKLSSYEELVKNGMNGKDAAKLANNVYGGINWEQMGRSKDMQNFFRATILAPDWAESTLRLGGNFAKALNPVEKSAVVNRYRTMMATVLASYVAHNITNKLISGHYSYQNDPGHTFEIEAGYTSDGEKRYIRPYGTALDMFRLPYDIALGAVKGDFSKIQSTIRNRVSIPLGVVYGLISDTDYRGNTIGYRGKDKFGNQMPASQRLGNIAGEAATFVGLPSFIKQGISTATGQQSLEAGLTQAVELPVRYQGAGSSKTQNFVGKVSGSKGKDLYDLKKRFQGESPLSENQKRMVNQGGMPALDAIMNQRTITRQSNQIKDVQKKAANGEISPEKAQKAMQDILKQPVNTPKQSSSGINQAHAADNGVFEYNNKYSYITPSGKMESIDINPPTKGTGIDAFVNSDWNITKAREVWNSQLPQNTKETIFKKLGLDPKDVRYDALANHNTDVSTQYLLSKSPSHDILLHNILTGRQESISGTMFASNGVIDNLVEQGKLTKDEAKTLKALKFDRNSNKIGESTAKGKKGKKLPKMAVKKANFKIATSQSQAKTIKSGKPIKIKTPNVSFDTQFSKKGSIPQAKKYAVKFNV